MEASISQGDSAMPEQPRIQPNLRRPVHRLSLPPTSPRLTGWRPAVHCGTRRNAASTAPGSGARARSIRSPSCALRTKAAWPGCCRSAMAGCSRRPSPSIAAPRRSWRRISPRRRHRHSCAGLRRLPPDEFRGLRHAGAQCSVRHQRFRRDAAGPLGMGSQAACRLLRACRPEQWPFRCRRPRCGGGVRGQLSRTLARICRDEPVGGLVRPDHPYGSDRDGARQEGQGTDPGTGRKSTSASGSDLEYPESPRWSAAKSEYATSRR